MFFEQHSCLGLANTVPKPSAGTITRTITHENASTVRALFNLLCLDEGLKQENNYLSRFQVVVAQ